jgi:hypothetical protein
MNNTNPFIPVIMAAGIAVVGCATAFYLSDSGNTNYKKNYIINTNKFDDEIDNTDDYDSSPQIKRKYNKQPKHSVYDIEEDDEDEDEDDEDEDEDEDDEDEDVEEYDEDAEYDEDDGGFLMPGKKHKKRVVSQKKNGKR